MSAALKQEMITEKDRIAYNAACTSPSEMLPPPERDINLDDIYDVREFYTEEQIKKILNGPKAKAKRFRKNLEYIDTIKKLRVSVVPISHLKCEKTVIHLSSLSLFRTQANNKN